MTNVEQAKCELCGEPMPTGEEMFKFHGYSGPCPKPPLEPHPLTHWNKITQGQGKTGIYFVAYWDELSGEVEVSTGSCINGSWRKPVYMEPIAWLPMPAPPTLEQLGIVRTVERFE